MKIIIEDQEDIIILENIVNNITGASDSAFSIINEWGTTAEIDVGNIKIQIDSGEEIKAVML